jgi:hypothetical protein
LLVPNRWGGGFCELEVSRFKAARSHCFEDFIPLLLSEMHDRRIPDS